MSPRRSKTIVVPSGETSSDIQVPSSVTNSIFSVVLSGNSSGFFLSSFFSSWDAAVPCASAGIVMITASNNDRSDLCRTNVDMELPSSLIIGSNYAISEIDTIRQWVRLVLAEFVIIPGNRHWSRQFDRKHSWPVWEGPLQGERCGC